jgi:ribonucleoside-diphosphate reductase beta chain
MQAIGYEPPFEVKTNPIPWINHWLVSDNVQVAPQEAEISSYLVGQINSKVDSEDLSSFEL